MAATLTIDAGQYLPSADSIVSASSAFGVSGNVIITQPRVDLNGTLVVLSSELRSAVAVTRASCAGPTPGRQSSLVEAGRGGLPEDPNASLPALYLAGRDLQLGPRVAPRRADAGEDLPSTPDSRLRCG
jgi:large exoprotein involved in heme utilization and adhesion